MPHSFEGFYALYLTGSAGSSFGMLTFRDGLVAGVDIGGGKYTGTYVLDAKQNTVHCIANFFLGLGNQSITGAHATIEPIQFSVTLVLPTEVDSSEHHRIETPIGPVNARFEKIRGFEV